VETVFSHRNFSVAIKAHSSFDPYDTITRGGSPQCSTDFAATFWTRGGSPQCSTDFATTFWTASIHTGGISAITARWQPPHSESLSGEPCKSTEHDCCKDQFTEPLATSSTPGWRQIINSTSNCSTDANDSKINYTCTSCG